MKRKKRTHGKVNIFIKLIKITIIPAIILAAYLIIPTTKPVFQSLETTKNYAKRLEEFPPIDNNDWLKPDYTTFLQKIQPGFFGFFKNQFNPKHFKTLLHNIVKSREESGYSGDFVIKLTPQPNANFIVFGDLQGALHSFTRDLEKLNDLEIINNNFEIIKPNHFIIFNGDVVNRSPYSLETLSIVLQLMHKNPDKIFYIRGHQEDEANLDYGLTNELTIKAKSASEQTPPLKNEIIKLFATLPLAVFLQSPNGTDIVKISHLDSQENPLINESNFAAFLKKKGPFLEKLRLDDKTQLSNEPVQVKSVIKAIHATLNVASTTGLTSLPSQNSATTWGILSCPTSAYKNLQDFVNDAFCIINVDKQNKWTISLYAQNSKTKAGFNKSQFDLFSTSSEQAGDVITIGTILDKTGAISETHLKRLEGMVLRIDLANQNKELGNKRINLIHLDHQYNGAVALTQLQKLYNDHKIDILLRPMGSEPIAECLPFIKEKNMAILFPTVSASIFKDYKNYVLLTASYEPEAIALTRYAVEKLAAKKIAFFYQNDDFGKYPVNASIEVLKQLNFPESNILKAPYERSSTDIGLAIEVMKKFDPDCIICAAVTIPATRLISQIDTISKTQEKTYSKNVLAISTLDINSFRDAAKNKGVKVFFSHGLPDFKNSKIKIVEEYLTALKKTQQAPDYPVFLGYVTVECFLEALKQIQGNITKEKILEKIEKMKNYNLKGLTLNFDETTKALINDIWIETPSGDWIKQELTTQKPPTEIKAFELSVGSIADLSGGVYEVHAKLIDGVKLGLAHANEIIPNIKIKYVVRDHQYDPRMATIQVKKLFNEDKINTLLAPAGSPTLKACLPFIKEHNMLILFAEGGSSYFRQPQQLNLVAYKVSYSDEATALINYAINKLLINKFAFFYQDDEYGQAPFETATKMLEAKGIKQNEGWIATNYIANSTNISKPAEDIKSFKPEALFFFSTVSPSSALISKLGINTPKYLFWISPLNDKNFVKTIKSKGLSFISSHTIPNNTKLNLEIVNNFYKAIEKTSVGPEDYSLEGYIDASIFVDIIKQLDPPITKDKIIKKIESIKNYNFKGLKLNFDPQTRQLCKDLWLEDENGEWIYKPIE